MYNCVVKTFGLSVNVQQINRRKRIIINYCQTEHKQLTKIRRVWQLKDVKW